MDLNPTPEEVQFRKEVRSWLAANLPDGWGTPAFKLPETIAEKITFARSWQAKLYAGGWAGLTWPKEYGGRGAGIVDQLIFGEEYAHAQAPDTVNISVGTSLVGPTLIARERRRNSSDFSTRSSRARRSGARAFLSPVRARTWRRFEPGARSRATRSS